MIEQQLTLSDLPVSSSEIYEMMGYGNQTVPEPEIEAETQKLLKQISAIARPSFLFFSINGQLDTMKETLTVEHITFHLGKFCFFCCHSRLRFRAVSTNIAAGERSLKKLYCRYNR